MAYDNESVHTCKENVYPHLAKVLEKGPKRILTFPSKNAKELVYLLSVGKITTNDHIVAIEGDRNLVAHVRARLKSLGFKSFEILYGKAENLAKEIIERHLEKRFDLIFLDFCGNLKTDTANFINTIRFVLRDTDMAATFNLNFRGCYHELEENHQFFDYSIGEDYSLIGINPLNEGDTVAKAEWTCGRFWESMEIGEDEFDLLHSIVIYREPKLGCPPMLFFMNKGVPSKSNREKNQEILNELIAKEAEKKDTTNYVKGAAKAWALRRAKAASIETLQDIYTRSTPGIKAAITVEIRCLKNGEYKWKLTQGYVVTGYIKGQGLRWRYPENLSHSE